MKLSELLAEKLNQKQNAIKAFPARLGDGKGKVIAGPGLVYVMIDDVLSVASCNNVPPVHGLEVWVGYDPLQSQLLRVLGQREFINTRESYPNVTSHAAMHEFLGSGALGGTDVIKVQLQQFMPLAVWPYQGMQVIIYPGIVWLNNQYKLIADLNQYGKPIPKIIDFGEYPSPDTDKEMYYLVGIDNTGNIQVVAGNQVNWGTISLTDIPSPPENMVYSLAAIRRMRDQAAITINRESTDIVDLRFPIRHIHNDYLRSNAILNDLSDVDITSPQNGEVIGYDASTQTWKNRSGGGDMLKSVYDADNDGIVDAAESVDWTGVQNKPATYPPESHQHDAGAIVSGTLSTDRFSAYGDLQAESRIGMGIGLLPTGTDLRRALNQSSDITEDFTDASLPSGWSWADSPFITPPTVDYAYSGTLLRARGYTTAFRSFLFKTAPNLYAYSILCGFEVGTQTGAYAGVRLDDGTDNNYVEVVWWNTWSTTEPNICVYLRQRTGGGTVAETEMTNMRQTMPLTFTRLTIAANGTRWSNWIPVARLDNQYFRLRGAFDGTSVAWTPTRAGVVFGAPAASNWMVWGVDAVAF